MCDYCLNLFISAKPKLCCFFTHFTLLQFLLCFWFTPHYIMLSIWYSFITQGADVTDPGTETEESLGASDSTQRPADSQTSSCKIQEILSNPCIHLKLSTCAHKLSSHSISYLTLTTQEDVMCCCLSERKTGTTVAKHNSFPSKHTFQQTQYLYIY